jgi:hypothetical protein
MAEAREHKTPIEIHTKCERSLWGLTCPADLDRPIDANITHAALAMPTSGQSPVGCHTSGRSSSQERLICPSLGKRHTGIVRSRLFLHALSRCLASLQFRGMRRTRSPWVRCIQTRSEAFHQGSATYSRRPSRSTRARIRHGAADGSCLRVRGLGMRREQPTGGRSLSTPRQPRAIRGQMSTARAWAAAGRASAGRNRSSLQPQRDPPRRSSHDAGPMRAKTGSGTTPATSLPPSTATRGPG